MLFINIYTVLYIIIIIDVTIQLRVCRLLRTLCIFKILSSLESVLKFNGNWKFDYILDWLNFTFVGSKTLIVSSKTTVLLRSVPPPPPELLYHPSSTYIFSNNRRILTFMVSKPPYRSLLHDRIICKWHQCLLGGQKWN